MMMFKVGTTHKFYLTNGLNFTGKVLEETDTHVRINDIKGENRWILKSLIGEAVIVFDIALITEGVNEGTSGWGNSHAKKARR